MIFVSQRGDACHKGIPLIPATLWNMKLRRTHIDTRIEHVLYMRSDCPVFHSEGFQTLKRVTVSYNGRDLVATLNVVGGNLLEADEVGLSEGAWHRLQANEGDEVTVSHPHPVQSLRWVRAKMYGNRLEYSDFTEILTDALEGRYSGIELSAYVAACSGDRLDISEITALTRAMTDIGQKLRWQKQIVVDKHSVGGLPGNRTTPIVVAIAAECGLMMPKTSSRAITSPAGTADTMETITNVNLDVNRITDVVERQRGCFVWGGSVNLSPADDVVIRVERALEIDSEGQMIASVLSKKSAAGSTHVLLDIPVGPSAKVRSQEKAEKLKYYFSVVAAELGLKVKVLFTDGTQPVGRGIGPALEAADVLSVLRNEPGAPKDLRERALFLAGEVLELAGFSEAGKGLEAARSKLDSGDAYRRFRAICEAQGRFSEPVRGSVCHEVLAEKGGEIICFDNRRLARIAKLAGAPVHSGAGLLLNKKVGDEVKPGELLFTVYAEGRGELDYALSYLRAEQDIIVIR
jgi:thymidine phosphorylase